ncbi:MAG: chromate transporter, partial [Candidatus Krumholzibacteria bacterium]|nr:chromate transporter [Candidatus Krumholzibacteria bacterium]
MNIYWSIFFSFLRVGLFGFGGGPALIPLIEKEVVDHYGWLTAEEFIDVLAMANALPGPIATKMALCIGLRMGGA